MSFQEKEQKESTRTDVSKVTAMEVSGPTEGWMGVLDLESIPAPIAIPEPVAHPDGAATLGDKSSNSIAVPTNPLAI